MLWVEDEDGGTGFVTSLFLPSPFSLPFPLRGENNLKWYIGSLPSCVHIDETNIWLKSEKVAKPKVLFEGETAYTILQYIGYICSHRDLVYCFVNKRRNSGYMYRFLFFIVDTYFAFPGPWGRQGEVHFSFCGVYHWKDNPTVPEGIQSPLALIQGVVLTLLFCHFTPTGQPGTRCDMEVFGLSRSRGHVSNLNIPGTWHF